MVKITYLKCTIPFPGCLFLSSCWKSEYNDLAHELFMRFADHNFRSDQCLYNPLILRL